MQLLDEKICRYQLKYIEKRYDGKTLSDAWPGTQMSRSRLCHQKDDILPLVTFAWYQSPSDDQEVTTGKSGSREIVLEKLFAVDSARVCDGEHLLPLSRV